MTCLKSPKITTAKNKPYYTSSLIVLEIAKIGIGENLTHLPIVIFAKISQRKNFQIYVITFWSPTPDYFIDSTKKIYIYLVRNLLNISPLLGVHVLGEMWVEIGEIALINYQPRQPSPEWIASAGGPRAPGDVGRNQRSLRHLQFSLLASLCCKYYVSLKLDNKGAYTCTFVTLSALPYCRYYIPLKLDSKQWHTCIFVMLSWIWKILHQSIFWVKSVTCLMLRNHFNHMSFVHSVFYFAIPLLVTNLQHFSPYCQNTLHAPDVFTMFYICKVTVLVNIVKIKRSRI